MWTLIAVDTMVLSERIVLKWRRYKQLYQCEWQQQQQQQQKEITIGIVIGTAGLATSTNTFRVKRPTNQLEKPIDHFGLILSYRIAKWWSTILPTIIGRTQNHESTIKRTTRTTQAQHTTITIGHGRASPETKWWIAPIAATIGHQTNNVWRSDQNIRWIVGRPNLIINTDWEMIDYKRTRCGSNVGTI